MALPGTQTFAQSDLDNLSDAEIRDLLSQIQSKKGKGLPPPKVPAPVNVVKIGDGK